MILKIRTSKKLDAWVVYDRIENLTYNRISYKEIEKWQKKKNGTIVLILPWNYLYESKEQKEKFQDSQHSNGSGIFISCLKNKEGFSCIARDACYLCNDEGKTIEKLNYKL